MESRNVPDVPGALEPRFPEQQSVPFWSHYRSRFSNPSLTIDDGLSVRSSTSERISSSEWCALVSLRLELKPIPRSRRRKYWLPQFDCCFFRSLVHFFEFVLLKRKGRIVEFNGTSEIAL